MQAVQEQQARLAAEAEAKRRAAAFKAAPAPERKPPAPLVACDKPLTRPQPPALALDARAPERAAFNAQLRAKQEALEVGRAAVQCSGRWGPACQEECDGWQQQTGRWAAATRTALHVGAAEHVVHLGQPLIWVNQWR